MFALEDQGLFAGFEVFSADWAFTVILEYFSVVYQILMRDFNAVFLVLLLFKDLVKFKQAYGSGPLAYSECAFLFFDRLLLEWLEVFGRVSVQ